VKGFPARTAILAAAAAMAACAPPPAPDGIPGAGPAAGRPAAQAVQVESVRILSLQSYPARIQIVVDGTMTQGADLEIQQRRTDNVVVVTLTEKAGASSTAVRVPFSSRILLDGGFPAGKYALEVNEYRTTFEP
jgi:hypothetical protein